MPTYSFRLSCLVTMVTILLGSHISFTSARHTDKSTRLQTSRISKRDAEPRNPQRLGTGGLEMHCKLHPRNCVGGYMVKKGGDTLLEKLRRMYNADIGLDDQGSSSLSSSSSMSSDGTGRGTPMGTYPAINHDDRVFQEVMDLLQNVRRSNPTPNRLKPW